MNLYEAVSKGEIACIYRVETKRDPNWYKDAPWYPYPEWFISVEEALEFVRTHTSDPDRPWRVTCAGKVALGPMKWEDIEFAEILNKLDQIAIHGFEAVS